MPRHHSSSSAIDDVRIGQVFAERYEIVRRLGSGGMAVVYAGIDRTLMRDVALKILKPSVMNDATAVERLRREARAAGQLHHRHIITFHDVGTADDGTVFIVMELLRGRTVAAERRRCQRLAAGRVARIGAQVASALRVVHQAGIVHRDLKPDNVFLIENTTDDFCKLLDFSIAKLPAVMVDGRITQTGTVHGTPHYMSPEQAVGDPVSPVSDIYSLGAVLFELLVGRPPFFATNVVELLIVQGCEDAPRVRTLEPDCPAALDDFVARMLDRSAADRPASADEVYQVLTKIAAQCEQKGGEPPPLPRKRMAAADRTMKSSAYAADALRRDQGGSGAPLLDAAPLSAPSAPSAMTSSAMKPAHRGRSTPLPARAASDVSHDMTRVKRPQSMKSRAVTRRASAAAPIRRPGARTMTRARARPPGTNLAGTKLAPPRDQPDGTDKTSPSPPHPLPDSVDAAARVASRNLRSTVPSWSGQTSPSETAVTQVDTVDDKA